MLRLTKPDYKKSFESAIYWQNKLLPLGIPLAEFIVIDLDGKISDFPALLMHRLPGNDLCNVYSTLSVNDKKNCASEIVKIQSLTAKLPEASGFGYALSYETDMRYKTWYDYLVTSLGYWEKIFVENNAFGESVIPEILTIAKKQKDVLSDIPPQAFLGDAAERNVIIDQGRIIGIIDIDEMFFGDPLFVIGLTYAALEKDGYDTIYPDAWVELLQLDTKGNLRLAFYRLFYTALFMRQYCEGIANNNQNYNLNKLVLSNMFKQALERL